MYIALESQAQSHRPLRIALSPMMSRLSSVLCLLALSAAFSSALSISSLRYTGTYITSTEDYSHLVLEYSYKKTDASKFSIYIYDTHTHKSKQVVKTVTKPSGSGKKTQYINAYVVPGYAPRSHIAYNHA